MNFAIIAAGEGSRLAKEGFELPKPMVSLNGEMLIDRLIRIFKKAGAAEIRIIINEQSPVLEAHLTSVYSEGEITLVKKTTPSSLHSFYELINHSSLDNVCLTTTDTVFNEEDFLAYIEQFEAQPELNGLMAVTSFVDDESPLYVEVNDSFEVLAFADHRTQESPYVSGGIYCLRGEALATATNAVEAGVSRMRNFQRQLLVDQLRIKAFPFSKIVDVDHVADIATAEAFLQELAENNTI